MKLTASEIFDGIRFSGPATVEFSREGFSRVINGGSGGVILPGITDSHVHLLGEGLNRLSLDLAGCDSRESFRTALSSYASTRQGQWVTGRGWDQNRLGFTPDRHFLDSIVPKQPVVLKRVCGHVLAVNSVALQFAGLTEDVKDVPGGVILKDDQGPTGILEEHATDLVLRHVPTADGSLMYDALAAAIEYAYSCGITGVHTDDLNDVGSYEELWHLYDRVTSSYPMRVQLHYHIKSASDLAEYIVLKKELQQHPLLSPGAAKMFLDGSLGARTAALRDDYTDEKGNKGVLILPREELLEIVSLAEKEGIQLALHAIGDAAIEQALDVLSIVREQGGTGNRHLPHRLIHCQVTGPGQLERMAAMGIAAEIQPVFLQTDKDWVSSRLGYERLQSSYCWRDMWNQGVLLTGGSDAPVEDMNPWWGIHTAVTRCDNQNRPAEGWEREQSLSLEQALQLFTANPPQLTGWKNGQIRPSFQADMAYYQSLSRTKLWDNAPSALYIDGDLVWKA